MSRATLASVGRLAVAVLLTALLLWHAEPRQVAGVLAGIRWEPLWLAIGLVLVDRTLMAYRWLVLLRPFADGSGPPLGAVLRIFLVSTFVGTVLPATVGADAVRAYALSRLGVSPAVSVASVLMDRLLGVVSILLAALVGLAFAGQLAAVPWVWGLVAVTALACLAAAALVFSPRVAALALRVVALLPGAWLRQTVERTVDTLQRYADHRGVLLNVLAGSLGVQALRTLQAWALGLALGLAVPWTAYVAFIPIILLVMLAPITINGLGTSQALFVWAFAQVGVSPAAAFALSLLFVGLGVVGNLPGGVLYAAGQSGTQNSV